MLYVDQKVVCIDNKPQPGKFWESVAERPVVGRIYTIANIYYDDIFGEEGVELVELRRDESAVRYGMIGYLAKRFRPVVDKKTDISIFTEILVDVNAGKEIEVVGG